MHLDIAYLNAWIGREALAEDLVTHRLVEEFRATFDPHLAIIGEGEAPLALHWCLAPEIPPMAVLGRDGHAAKGDFLPPIPLPRRMWAGGEIETLDALRIGDGVIRRSTVSSIDPKDGQSGRLCFVGVRHELSTGRGVAIRERHDIVYRDESSTGTTDRERAASEPNVEPRSADLEWLIDASPVLLFRYSAMTFNGHRFHYDQPYATGVEGYAGLVVHGPLQATLLYNLAAMVGSQAPTWFRYRGRKPLIAGEYFKVRGSRLPDGNVACWTENARGEVCMEAEAAWKT